MKKRTPPKLELQPEERKALRQHKIKIGSVIEYAPEELERKLDISLDRAREIYALADFQRIPSIGIEFAKDLIFLGYRSVSELKEKDGGQLLNDYEKRKGYQTDPCVEDQFRLVVHFARTDDYSKTWWGFTKERKAFRAKHGYPKDRPRTHWTEV